MLILTAFVASWGASFFFIFSLPEDSGATPASHTHAPSISFLWYSNKIVIPEEPHWLNAPLEGLLHSLRTTALQLAISYDALWWWPHIQLIIHPRCETFSLFTHPVAEKCSLVLAVWIKLTVSVTMDRKVSKSSFSECNPKWRNPSGKYFNPKALQIAPLKTNSHFTDNTVVYMWVGWDSNKQNSLMAF